MITLLRVLFCKVFGHRPRVTVRGPSQALLLHTHLIDGGCVEREIQGFMRTSTCPRCKVVEYQIVFENGAEASMGDNPRPLQTWLDN